MSRQSQTVTFEVACPEPRAWLVLTSPRRKPRVMEMNQRSGSMWSADARLAPGEYLCRYYGGDEQRVIYYGAANREGSVDCGLDALISVKGPPAVEAPSAIQ